MKTRFSNVFCFLCECERIAFQNLKKTEKVKWHQLFFYDSNIEFCCNTCLELTMGLFIFQSVCSQVCGMWPGYNSCGGKQADQKIFNHWWWVRKGSWMVFGIVAVVLPVYFCFNTESTTVYRNGEVFCKMLHSETEAYTTKDMNIQCLK